MGSWLPTWALTAWCAIFAIVLALHLFHVARMSGRARVWHVGHSVMALGMVDMYWPSGNPPVGETPGTVIFAVLAVVALVATVVSRLRGATQWLWAMLVVDFAVMAYMFAMMSHRWEALTLILTVWCAIEAVAWFTGLLNAEVHAQHAVIEPSGATDATGGHADASLWSVRITLGVMALGTAYMLLAMQYGMSDMDMGDMDMSGDSGSSNMSDMPGMDMGGSDTGTTSSPDPSATGDMSGMNMDGTDMSTATSSPTGTMDMDMDMSTTASDGQ